MTLVVTEVSEKWGCVVAGDTAVTTIRNGVIKVVPGARKVRYAADAKIGFAIWGNACLGGRRLDELLSEFADGLSGTETPRSAGQRLAATLTSEGQKDGQPWGQGEEYM